MRDNILNGELSRYECDDEDMSQFLLLLKISNGLTPVNEEEIR